MSWTSTALLSLPSKCHTFIGANLLVISMNYALYDDSAVRLQGLATSSFLQHEAGV